MDVCVRLKLGVKTIQKAMLNMLMKRNSVRVLNEDPDDIFGQKNFGPKSTFYLFHKGYNSIDFETLKDPLVS